MDSSLKYYSLRTDFGCYVISYKNLDISAACQNTPIELTFFTYREGVKITFSYKQKKALFIAKKASFWIKFFKKYSLNMLSFYLKKKWL